MRTSPPLRFLGTVLGGWVVVRAALLITPASEPPGLKERTAARAARGAYVSTRDFVAVPNAASNSIGFLVARPVEATPTAAWPIAIQPASAPLPLMGLNVSAVQRVRVPAVAVAPPPFVAPLHLEGVGRRWSASAWAFLREENGRSLSAGGLLGGSQIGARIAYRLNDDIRRPLSLSGRLYAPIESNEAAEVALGLEWQPIAELPVRILAERRQALGSKGRSAFAIMAYGGISRRQVIGSAQLNAYAQAGIVGTRSRDLFVDGAATLSVPLAFQERLRLGAGLWGAAQPGVSRLDVGPSLSLDLPIERKTLRLSAEWRQRLAGDAAPASGPALTLATDF